MATFVMFSDIVEENGKTIRENNLAKTHKYPLGTVVTVHTGDGATERSDGRSYYVVGHGRDCDGTPLYTYSASPYPPCTNPQNYTYNELSWYVKFGERRWESCHGEESLRPVPGENTTYYRDFVTYVRKCLEGEIHP